MISVTNEDNMALMARYPNNHFDLAIVDPEYGIGASKPSKKPNRVKQKNGNILNVKAPKYTPKDWDNKPAGQAYFDELRRVSKNQIIWGVNFYNVVFGKGRIVWDKLNGDSDQYDCEIAYNSINDRTEIVRYMWSGMMQGKQAGKNLWNCAIQQGNKKLNEKRIHPTQKPVKVYEWIIERFAQPNYRILDTHGGSLSIAIAIHNLNLYQDMNLELTACEIDVEIYKDAMNRLTEHQSKTQLF